MKTAAIYARVSTGEQVSGTSLDSQVKACREYAHRQGYRIVEAGIIQESISGTELNRPGLGKVMEMAARKEIDTLILAKVDRLARGRMVDSLLEADLRSWGIEVLYVNRDTGTSEGRLLVNIEKDFAEWERERISERTWGGKMDRAQQQALDPKQGLMSGRMPPYGYELAVIGKRATKHRTVPIHSFAVLESEAQWVRKMFDWLVNERCSLWEIMQRLNDLEVPTKQGRRFWQRATLGGIFANPVYVGDWYWGKTHHVKAQRNRSEEGPKRLKSSQMKRPQEEWIRIPVPAIIPRELYDAAQVQLQRNRERSGRPSARKDLLRGLLRCIYCGRALVAHEDKRRKTDQGGNIVKYVCSGHRTPGLRESCRSGYPAARKIEGDLWASIAQYLSHEDVLFALIKEREAGREDERSRDLAALADICEKQAAIKRQRHTLADALLDEPPRIDRETAQERTAYLDRQAGDLQAARAGIEGRMSERQALEINETVIRGMCERVRERLPYITEEDKRAWLEVLNVRGAVCDKGIEFTWIIGAPFTLLLERQAAGECDKLCTYLAPT
jgi:site-specific DNA recombinase